MGNDSLSDETSAPRLRTKRSEWLCWLAPVALLATAFALQGLASRKPQFVERYYSRKIFPPIIHTLSLINGVVGFSIAELLIYVLAVALVATVVYQARQLFRRRLRLARVIRTDLLALLWIFGSAMLLFLLTWGLNYQREPLGGKLGFTGRNASEGQWKMISEIIVNEVNSNYSTSHSRDAARPSRTQVYELIESAYQQEVFLADAARGRFGPPKPIYSSGLMSRLGLSGFYMPFTGEPNFNSAQPDFDLPYVTAHEKAHQHGFAREDEANFIAFVVCVNSTNPFVRYSGYLNGLRVLWAFAPLDPEFYKRLNERIGEGPRQDLEARAEFWARYEGPARAVAHKVNDSYLKANRIGSGAQNYGEDIALIIGYYLVWTEKLMRTEKDRR